MIQAERGERVRREIELDAAPDEVWRALRTPGEWLGEALQDGELEEGGTLAVRDDDGERHGVVEAVEPPEHERPGRLAWWWWRGDEPATHVEVLVVGGPARTRVIVVEARPAAGPVMGARWVTRLARVRAATRLVSA